jgi:hypothetical protein
VAPSGIALSARGGDTYANGYSSWAFGGSFTQTFVAQAKGYPRRLAVHLGNNQTPFSVTLDVSVNGQNVFSRRYNSLVQQYSDWSVPFDLGTVGVYVNVGDIVSFTLSSPSTSIGFAAVRNAISGYTMGTVSGYGSTNSRFYFGSFPFSFFVGFNQVQAGT